MLIEMRSMGVFNDSFWSWKCNVVCVNRNV